MKNLLKLALIVPIIILLSAMTVTKVKPLKFKHPKKPEYLIQIETDNLAKFRKEWRGEDYYYNNLGKSEINCSLLFHKLNEQEVKQLGLYPQELT